MLVLLSSFTTTLAFLVNVAYPIKRASTDKITRLELICRTTITSLEYISCFCVSCTMDLTNENPWKLKGKIKFIGCCDVIVASFGIVYASYQMFDYYMFIGDKEGVNDIMKGTGHIPFYIFIWSTVVLQYAWVVVVALVLVSAVSLEATETDPHTSIQKCVCWLRTARLNLFVIFIKLCLQPILIVLEKSTHLYGILFGVLEFVFKCTAVCWVKMFMQDLQ